MKRMNLKKRMLSLVLSAVMLIAPAASFAEEAQSSYYAGELASTVISDSYVAGNQINLDVVFGMDTEKAFDDERVQAALNLLSKSRLHMSFYDDFGTARIHAELETDGVNMVTADMLIYEDGSVQAMSSLTGNLVLALPAGTFVNGQLQLGSLANTDVEYDLDTKEGIEAFEQLPVHTRLAITGSDVASTLINHLLGWTSYAQMDSDGELYVFDDTYLDATEDRDPVAQRMLGKIEAHRFNTLMWNVATTICDDKGQFQLAIADLLAKMGVTRRQMRLFTDALMTKETIDPMLDFVQPSYYIIENDDGSLCDYDDVSYFFKKLVKCTDRVWENSTDNTLTMDVSYDDFGGMVGFDAHLAQFTPELPFEGTFNYSIRTDDDWQRFHTAHGELQVYNDNRVIGDIDMQFGEDVGGVNETRIVGAADVVNQRDNTSAGIGLDAGLTFETDVAADGTESETFEGSVVLSERANGEGHGKVCASASGVTTTDGDRFDLLATAALEVAGRATLVADVALVQADYEEIPFAGGQALDLTDFEAAKKIIKDEVKAQAAKLGVSLVTHPSVLADLAVLYLK